MPYLGVAPNPRQNREVDDISSGFNGSTTAFTLQVNSQNVSPGSENSIIVSVGGIVQNPGTDYTIAASTITFTTAPASGLSFFGLVLGQGIVAVEAADGSITATKLASPLDLPDNQKIRFGTGNDLEIFFDASNSIIREPNAVAGQLIIDGYNGTDIRQGSTGEHMIRAIGGADVELYHNGTKQCETSTNGLAFPNGKGIDFSAQTATSASGASTSSELLDHYEEGTWTGLLNGGNFTATQTNFVYTRIGRKVTVNGTMTGFSSSSNGSNLELTGIPFSTESGVAFVGSASYSKVNTHSGYSNPAACRVEEGSNRIVFMYDGEGANARFALRYVDLNNTSDSLIQFTVTYFTA